MGPQLYFIFIVVSDMARSLTFYEHLGFKFPPKAFGEPHVEAELPGGIRVFWDDVQTVKVYAPDYEPSRHGRIGLGIQLDTPAEVDALFERLKNLGHRGDRTPWDAPWGSRYAIVYDPDGNMIELHSPFPNGE